MSKEHCWAYGRVDQYVNGFFRDDEPDKMTLMPESWETAFGYPNGEFHEVLISRGDRLKHLKADL